MIRTKALQNDVTMNWICLLLISVLLIWALIVKSSLQKSVWHLNKIYRIENFWNFADVVILILIAVSFLRTKNLTPAALLFSATMGVTLLQHKIVKNMCNDFVDFLTEYRYGVFVASEKVDKDGYQIGTLMVGEFRLYASSVCEEKLPANSITAVAMYVLIDSAQRPVEICVTPLDAEDAAEIVAERLDAE